MLHPDLEPFVYRENRRIDVDAVPAGWYVCELVGINKDIYPILTLKNNSSSLQVLLTCRRWSCRGLLQVDWPGIYAEQWLRSPPPVAFLAPPYLPDHAAKHCGRR